MKALAIDPRRLARAVWLSCQRVAPDRWLVTGGADDHLVVVDGGLVRCGCIDSQRSGENCEHSLAVRLSEGDRDVVRVLRRLVPRPLRAMRAA